MLCVCFQLNYCQRLMWDHNGLNILDDNSFGSLVALKMLIGILQQKLHSQMSCMYKERVKYSEDAYLSVLCLQWNWAWIPPMTFKCHKIWDWFLLPSNLYLGFIAVPFTYQLSFASKTSFVCIFYRVFYCLSSPLLQALLEYEKHKTQIGELQLPGSPLHQPSVVEKEVQFHSFSLSFFRSTWKSFKCE